MRDYRQRGIIMHHECVLYIEPSLSETAISTPKLVVVSNLNYDYLGEIKYYCSHITIQVLTWVLLASTLRPCADPNFHERLWE